MDTQLLARALEHRQRGELHAAIELLQALRKHADNSNTAAAAALNEAVCQILLHNTQEARRLWHQAKHVTQLDIHARTYSEFVLGGILAAEGDEVGAVAKYEELLRLRW
jgi:hypothetical protein